MEEKFKEFENNIKDLKEDLIKMKEIQNKERKENQEKIESLEKIQRQDQGKIESLEKIQRQDQGKIESLEKIQRQERKENQKKIENLNNEILKLIKEVNKLKEQKFTELRTEEMSFKFHW